MAVIEVYQCRAQSRSMLRLSLVDANALLDLATSRGLSFGQGVFETLAVIDQVVVFQDAHFARMQAGAQALRLAFERELIQCQVFQFLQQYNATYGILKVTCVAQKSNLKQPRGYGSIGLHDSFLILQFSPSIPDQSSVRLCYIPDPCFPWPAVLVGLKLTSAMSYVHWSSYAYEQGADQGVLFDHQNLVVEATSSNIVLLNKTGVFVTPPMKHSGVHGVLRQWLLDEQKVIVQEISELDMMQAQCVYVVNSVRGFQRVSHYQGKASMQKWSCEDWNALAQRDCIIQFENGIQQKMKYSSNEK